MPVVIDSFEALPAEDTPSGDSKSGGKESKSSAEPPEEVIERVARSLAERAGRIRAH